MLAVIADILKIIGIILLCVILFLLTVILLLLFCPVRYRVDVKKEERLTGKAAVSWLFHIFRIEVIYRETVNLRVRVFGIPVFDKLKREARTSAVNSPKDHGQETATEPFDGGPGRPEPQPDMTAASVAQDARREAQREMPSEGRRVRGKKARKKTGKAWWDFPQYFFDMLMGWAEKILEAALYLPEFVEGPAEHLEEKISSIARRVDYYTKLLQKKGSKWAVDFLKLRACKLLKHLRPRNSRIDLYYAAEDPAKVANMMAYYGMALPFLPRNTNFTAELGAPRLEGNVRIKGRVFLIVVLRHGMSVYFNKKVRMFLKLLKEGQKISS